MSVANKKQSKELELCEINKLLDNGVLGFYNSVEVTEVFAISPDKKIVNVFTLMVAEHREQAKYNKEHFLADRPFKIKGFKNWIFGVKRYIRRKEDIIDSFQKLSDNGLWEGSSISEPIQNSKLAYCPKRFVAPDSFEEVPLNKILKNNFHNGSYVIEWFDNQKDNLSSLLNSPSLLQELSAKLQEYVPIALAALSDRIGNYILQIPSQILQAKFLMQDDHNLQCQIAWHPDAEKRSLLVNCSLDEADKLLEGYISRRITNEEEAVPLSFGYQKAHIGIIWDEKNELILAATRPSSFIRTIHFSSNIMHSEDRVIYQQDGEVVRIPLVTNSDHVIGSDEASKKHKDWTKKRIYKNDKLQLQKSKYLVQYKPKGNNKSEERKRALNDIRELIKTYGSKGVWLWDPYLSAKDILDTLFFNSTSFSEMRALTDLKEAPSTKKKICDDCAKKLCSDCLSKTTSKIKKPIREIYQNTFNNLKEEELQGINLEFRSPRGHCGWNFHDRFLLFPYLDDEPLVWSLGTSVNSLGQEHHILQKVSDGQLIVDAFSELWDVLSEPKCLIWRNNND